LNVLLTCAGRRNYLVQYFREALAGAGAVVAADAASHAPALQEADASVIVPKVDAPDYVDALLSVCAAHRIGMVLPLNDLELPVLAAAAPRFERAGIQAIVSSVGVIETGFDKWRTARIVEDSGLRAPLTYLDLASAERALADGILRFPVVVKPRWGTASLAIELAHDLEELRLARALVSRRIMRSFLASVSQTDLERCVLVQEMLRGDEYGLDIVNDLQGRYVTTFVKRKLLMRAGETDRAVTVDRPDLMAVGATIGARFGHVANMDCDCFVTDEGPVVLEINPRFGGGYPFSHAAGANLPAALLAWATGADPQPEWLTVAPGVASAKCDRLVRVTVGGDGL
jgi:carbamoyl-phosphate synthase large subunit